MPAPALGPSTAAASPIPAPNPASTTLTTQSTPATSAAPNPSPQNNRNTKWKTIKGLLPSPGAGQTYMGLAGLILAIVGVPWAIRSYNMARWTELKDFRDDCRSVQVSGTALSKACGEALGKELEPPPYAPAPYAPVHFSRLGKRDFYSAIAVEKVYPVMIEMWKFLEIWVEALLQGLRSSITLASQWARRCTTELLDYAETLYRNLLPWLPGLPAFFLNSNLHKVLSLLFHPWTFDGALLLLTIIQRFRYHNITFIQTLIILTVLLTHHLILWLHWCDECHGAWREIITRASDTIFCVLILKSRRVSDLDNFFAPGDQMIETMMGILLSYEVLLVVEGFRHLYTTVGFLLVSAVLLHGCQYEINSEQRPNLYIYWINMYVVGVVHVTELFLVISFRGWMLLFGKSLLFAFYGGIVWVTYEILRQRPPTF